MKCQVSSVHAVCVVNQLNSHVNDRCQRHFAWRLHSWPVSRDHGLCHLSRNLEIPLADFESDWFNPFPLQVADY